MARSNLASTWSALFAVSVGAACSQGGGDATTGNSNGGSGGNGVGGAGNGGASVTSSAVTTSSTGATASATTGTGGEGGAPFVCDPPAEPGSFYELSAPTYTLPEPISMCQYRGDVVLVVNTAAA